MQQKHQFTGLIAATFTPMDESGKLNLGVVPRIVDHLIADGVEGMYVCGSTGEGPSLTVRERQATAEAYVAASAGRIPVIVHVGHDSLEEAKGLAQHAADIGADATAAMPPAYFKCRTIDALVDSLAHIAHGAEALPFFYYHIPVLNGYTFSMIELLKRAPERIPNFVGLKYSSPDLAGFQGCVEFANGRYHILFGVDEMLLGALAMGATGAVGSTYNFVAPLYHKMMQALADGDASGARQHQGRAGDMVRILLHYRGQPAIKAMMRLIGLDCGPTRLPIVPLSDKEFVQLREELEEKGLTDWGRKGE